MLEEPYDLENTKILLCLVENQQNQKPEPSKPKETNSKNKPQPPQKTQTNKQKKKRKSAIPSTGKQDVGGDYLCHWAQSLIALWPVSIRSEMLTPAECFLSPCKKWKRLKDSDSGVKDGKVWKKCFVEKAEDAVHSPVPYDRCMLGINNCWLVTMELTCVHSSQKQHQPLMVFSWSYVSSAFSLGYMSLHVLKHFLNRKSSISLPNSFSLKRLKLIWQYFYCQMCFIRLESCAIPASRVMSGLCQGHVIDLLPGIMFSVRFIYLFGGSWWGFLF